MAVKISTLRATCERQVARQYLAQLGLLDEAINLPPVLLMLVGARRRLAKQGAEKYCIGVVDIRVLIQASPSPHHAATS
jgi:hypothetical protein